MSYIGTEPKDIRSYRRTKFDYTASQGQTAFTGADDDGKVLAFTTGQINVYVNGILMDDSDFTTTGTGTVTLASAANLNDVVNVVSFESNIPDNDYVPASGGTFTGAVTHSGAITLSGNVSGATTFTDSVTFQKNINVGNNTNLLSNAEFTTNTTGWTATGSTLAIVSNELQLTPGSGVNGFANQQVDNLVVGRSYIASVTVTVDAGSLSRLYIGTSANGNQTVNTSNLGTGTHSFTFTATATTHHFALVVGGGTGQVTRFDNAKLVEASRIEFPAASGTAPAIRQGASVNDLSIATNNINRLNVDSSGRVTMPNQPAFYAYTNAAQTTAGTCQFQVEDLDVTNSYNNSTGVFTAPIAGIYEFHVYLLIRLDLPSAGSTTDYGGARLKKNGGAYGADHYQGNGYARSHEAISFSHIGSLAANDTAVVNITLSTNAQIYGGGYSSFSGRLVS